MDHVIGIWLLVLHAPQQPNATEELREGK